MHAKNSRRGRELSTPDRPSASGRPAGFLNLVARVSRTLIASDAHSVPDRIREALSELADSLDLDVFELRRFDPGRTGAILAYGWSRAATGDGTPTLTERQVPWVLERARRGEAAVLPDVDAPPAGAAADAEFLRARGMRSLLTVPIFSEAGCRGVGLVATERAADWSDDERWELGLACEILQTACRRARVERDLAESESRYRGVVEDQAEGIVRWRPDGCRTFVNDSYCLALGESARTLVGGDLLGGLSGAARAALLADVRALSPDAPTSTLELRPGHAEVLQQWSNRGFFDATGRLAEVQSVIRDVAARGRGASIRLVDVEREHVRAVLEDSGWVLEGPRGAAAALGLAPSTLRSRMKKLGIRRPSA